MTWFRSTHQKKLAGICGGLSEMFHADISLIRFICVILIFTPIPITLAYCVAWFIVPQKGDTDVTPTGVNGSASGDTSRARGEKEFLTEN